MSVMLAIANGGGVGAGAAWWLISAGMAFTSPDVFDCAKITTLPVPAWSIPARDAVVSMFSMSIATEPAMLSDPPPAPLLADAPSACMPPARASIVAPFAVTVAPDGRIASLRMRA